MSRSKNIELRHLRYFLEVADTQNFGRAAARLGIAQPPLSRQISNLENEVGVRLFHRTSRGVTLTDAGVLFSQKAAQILTASEEAVMEAREASTGRSGCLTIGFVHSLSYSMLPMILPGFRQKHPGIQISLKEINISEKETALLSGQVDIGIFRPFVRHPEVDVLPIHDEGFVLAVPVSHRLAKKKRVPVRSLASETLIMFRPLRGDVGLHGTIATFLRNHNVPVVSRESVGTIHTALGLVASGAGITIVPESTMVIRINGVTYRRFTEATTRITSAVCWRNYDQSLLVDTFLTYVRSLSRAF